MCLWYLSINHTEVANSNIHWGRVINAYESVNWVTITSDNYLTPMQHQAIAWTNADLVLIKPLGLNFSKNLMEIQTFSIKKMYNSKCRL